MIMFFPFQVEQNLKGGFRKMDIVTCLSCLFQPEREKTGILAFPIFQKPLPFPSQIDNTILWKK